MKTKNTFGLLFFILLLAGCQNSDTEIDSFSVVSQIVEYDSIYSDKDTSLGYITDIEVSNGVLITAHGNDTYNYSFIDAAKNRLINRWGTRGEGPAEFIDFGSTFHISSGNLVFLETAKKEINSVKISDVLKGESPLIVKKEAYPYTVDFRPNKLSLIGDKKIVLGSFSSGRFGMLDSQNGIINISSDYPFDCGSVSDVYRGSVFQSRLKVNQKRDRFVISTLSSDVFEIYQLSETGVERIYTSPFMHAPKVWLKGGRFALDDDKNIAGFLQMAVSDDLICFTYSAKSNDEALRAGLASDEILCFNWDGRKIKKYLLPFSITNFCIDENYIYAVRNDNDETIIYRFMM